MSESESGTLSWKKSIEVVAAVIKEGGRIFATQRGYGEFKDRWEFPGGKMEPGESRRAALRREIREELATEISIERLITTIERDYPSFHLTMHCYLCGIVAGNLVLKEHESARWLAKDDLRSLDWLPADLDLIPLLENLLTGDAQNGREWPATACSTLDDDLCDYLDSEILPRYEVFDRAHGIDHVGHVVRESLRLAEHYDVDKRMVLVAAAYHDLGNLVGRETHHIESGKMLLADENLRHWFTHGQLLTMRDAIEDHRASSDHEPRTIYGKIVAEADRQIDPVVTIRRTVQFGLRHQPGLDREGHWSRTLDHLEEKYSERGYLKLWIPESDNAARLAELRSIISDKPRLRDIFDEIYSQEV